VHRLSQAIFEDSFCHFRFYSNVLFPFQKIDQHYLDVHQKRKCPTCGNRFPLDEFESHKELCALEKDGFTICGDCGEKIEIIAVESFSL
jgi:hypothetical protein